MTSALAAAVEGARQARRYMRDHGIRGGWTNAAVVDRALARGLDVGATPRGRVRLSDGRRTYWFHNGRTNLNRPMAVRTVRHRDVASAHLRARGFFAPENAVFAPGDGERAWRWSAPLTAMVLRPHDPRAQVPPAAGTTNREQFLDAFAHLAGRHGNVLVEEQVRGVELQVAVVANRVVAATRLLPAHVMGDGTSTIAELIGRKNKERKDSSTLIHRTLSPHTAEPHLEDQDLALTSVPASGRMVTLHPSPAWRSGGQAADATEELSAEDVERVEGAARTFPGLRAAHVKILLPSDGEVGPLCILRISSTPMLAMHHYPDKGEPRDAAGHLLEAMFPSRRGDGAGR